MSAETESHRSPVPLELAEQAFLDEPGPRGHRGHSFEAVAVAVLLFLATCVSTFWMGMAIGKPVPNPTWWTYAGYGLSYAGPLMLILLSHEMGHYLQARRYGVPATLPIFIPTPPGVGPFGTMGAVIVQAAGLADRKAMFDIAVWGPIAGFVVALPVAWLGIQQSEVVAFNPDRAYESFGDPLILKALVWLKHGTLPPGHDVVLNPLLYAGWVGIFLTGFNLIPIGQLDGGHILYTLIGRRAHTVAMLVLAAWIAYMFIAQYWVFALMVFLLILFGVRHPPTADDTVPLGTGRIVLGWLTMGLLVLCVTPRPFDQHRPEPTKSIPQPRQIQPQRGAGQTAWRVGKVQSSDPTASAL
jgi:membrane-associated protease RseP (regulator of RpoE activity)